MIQEASQMLEDHLREGEHTPAKVAVVDGEGMLLDANTRADDAPNAQTTVMKDLALLCPLLAGVE